MGVLGEVRVEPLGQGPVDAVIRVGANGLDKPLDKCSSKQIGRYGEDLASALLQSEGLEILDRNWFCHFGEADIVALEDGCVVLVEVKTRVAKGNDACITPEIAVDYRKQSRYQKIALMYLSKHSMVHAVRFDVVAVSITGPCEARLRHLTGAYEWDD